MIKLHQISIVTVAPIASPQKQSNQHIMTRKGNINTTST
jgi:hypothetical protein